MSDSSYSTSSRSILRCRFLGTQRATHVSWVVEHGWPLSLSYLGESSGSTIDAESDKGTSLNSASLAPKPLASSVYVHVPEARCPHKWSISVTSLFPSAWYPIDARSEVKRVLLSERHNPLRNKEIRTGIRVAQSLWSAVVATAVQ